MATKKQLLLQIKIDIEETIEGRTLPQETTLEIQEGFNDLIADKSFETINSSVKDFYVKYKWICVIANGIGWRIAFEKHPETWHFEKTFKKADLVLEGHIKGISQYSVKGDKKALICDTGGNYYLSYAKSESDQDFTQNIIDRVCGCYSQGYRWALLGEMVEVE